MANAQTQENTNMNDGQKSDTGERRNNNTAEEDNDDSPINSDFVIEPMSINPKAFTFRPGYSIRKVFISYSSLRLHYTA